MWRMMCWPPPCLPRCWAAELPPVPHCGAAGSNLLVCPLVLTVYNHTIYLDTTYMTAYGDVPRALHWAALWRCGWRCAKPAAPSGPYCRYWRWRPTSRPTPLCCPWWRRADGCGCLVFAEHPFKKGLARRTGFAIACFAAPMLIYYFWNIRYVAFWLPKVPARAAPAKPAPPCPLWSSTASRFCWASRWRLLRRAPEPVHPSHGRYGPPILDFGWSAEHDRPGPQCCGADSVGVLGGGHLRQRPPAQAAHWLHRGAVPCMLCGV